MIVVDTSALLAIILDEPEANDFMDFILLNDWAIGAPTIFEAHLALGRFRNEEYWKTLEFLIDRPNAEILPFDAGHWRLARTAFDLYGKGSGHRAGLNFGDCMTYAMARVLSMPLLYKGNDFIHTDIEPALRP